MIRSGMVSVTFCKLPPREIVRLTARAGLEGIEWGGDIHVPHGNRERAREVREMTEGAGLCVASYGSYCNLVGRDEPAFPAVVDTAAALRAPLIRVWAGEKGTADADDDYWKLVALEARRFAELARAGGMLVSFEYHHGTLTDSVASTRRLLEMCGHPSVGTYWQPSSRLAAEANAVELGTLMPWLTNLHVYQLAPDESERLPLERGTAAWGRYLAIAAAAGRDRYAMLEFVNGDDPQAFLRDAATLKILVAEAGGRDAGRNGQLVLRWWGLPTLVIVLATVGINATPLPTVIRGEAWGIAVGWLGLSCLRNARRCGRFHCVVLGIGYPLIELLALGIAFGLVPTEWNSFWLYVFLPVTLAAFVPEVLGLRYAPAVARRR